METVPQILDQWRVSLNYTPYDIKWLNKTPRFVVGGQKPNNKGALEIYELQREKGLVLKCGGITPHGIKCMTMGCASLEDAHLAAGDFSGGLSIYDLMVCPSIGEGPLKSMPAPVTQFPHAHTSVINAIDGVNTDGLKELVTGSRDGVVKVWDPRTPAPVVCLEPESGETPTECWTVCFGNSVNFERSVAAGYANGDVKLFDLRKLELLWDTNVGNGVCHLQFDRKDIKMNKLIVSTLESTLCMYDMRTYNPKLGFAGKKQKIMETTVWGGFFLPQNRDLFSVVGGNGDIQLYKYSYPNKRSVEDELGVPQGVAGDIELLNHKNLTAQPIVGLDWHSQKLGLGAFVSLSQEAAVIICTRLEGF